MTGPSSFDILKIDALEPWLDIKQAAKLANVSEGWMCKLATSGQIRSVKRGRMRRFRPEWIHEWMNGDWA